ncbi:MAG: hypothetical protein ACI9OJ_003286, partial [Myxococcota bacterium]
MRRYFDRLQANSVFVVALAACAGFAGCDSDSTDDATVDGTDGTSAADATDGTDGTSAVDATDGIDGTDGTDGPPLHPFRFGIDPGQNVSDAPFPNDLYIDDDGKVLLPPLHTDPVVSPLGKAALLELMTTQAAERTGYSTMAAVWFFMNEAPDPTTFEGNVFLVALEGPEAGRTVATQLKWNDRANAIGVFPAWGDYLVPDSTYGVYIMDGLKTAAGQKINHHPDFVAAIAQTAPTGDSHGAVRLAFAPLRKWFESANLDIGTIVIGTVFRTEPVVDYARQIFATIDAWTLQRPSADYRYDSDKGEFEKAETVSDDAIEDFFGTPEAPFEFNPGAWEGNRTRAASLPGYEKEYLGGTGHFRIAKVLSGSVVMPSFNYVIKDGAPAATRLRFEDGKAVSEANVMVPFTIFLCKDHIGSTKKLPVAIFSHGGGAIRSDAIAFANANCEAGVATAAIDMVFHGGRRTVEWVEGAKLIAPVESDTINVFSGKEEGDAGYVTDYIGDPGGAAASVAQLYGINDAADPMVIEANELAISADTYTFARYLLEGDWSDFAPDLAFDDARVFHNSLSFGTSYHTALLALTDVFTGIIGSVGTAYILNVNMPQAPANSLQASGLLIALLGLKGIPTSQLQAESQWSVVLGIHQWLHGRGDSMPYA